MRRIIQTQRLDANGTNAWGLYLNLDHISSVYYERSDKTCRVLMQDGTVYTIAHSVSEILEIIREQNARTLRTDVESFCNTYDLNTDREPISRLLQVIK